ncbi:hypothetical protein D9M71_760460 [compost metagenome]
MHSVGHTLEIIDEFFLVKAKIWRERRLVPGSFAAYRSANDDQAHPALRATLEERYGLLAWAAVFGRTKHRHRPKDNAVINLQSVDLQRARQHLGCIAGIDRNVGHGQNYSCL